MAHPVFIFMLTNNDRTIPDALERLPAVIAAGVRHIGFKDIGLPYGDLATLQGAIKAAGATSYLEVVSLDRESELSSVRSAIRLGVDYYGAGFFLATLVTALASWWLATSTFAKLNYLTFIGNNPSVAASSAYARRGVLGRIAEVFR